MNKSALLVIDLQYDYFPGGAFPLYNTDATLNAVITAIKAANSLNIPVINIQHIADPSLGISPFFNKDTHGAAIHSDILSVAPNAKVVVKHFADGFEGTLLLQTLRELDVEELIICGMMTQNCVAHTAISRRTDNFKKVTVLTDATTTVSDMLHQIALSAISPNVVLSTIDKVFSD